MRHKNLLRMRDRKEEGKFREKWIIANGVVWIINILT